MRETTKSCYKQIDNFKKELILGQNEDNLQDFSEGISPYCLDIFTYFFKTLQSVEDTRHEETYAQFIKSNLDAIASVTHKYTTTPQWKRIPYPFKSDCQRKRLIKSLQEIVDATEDLFLSFPTNASQKESNNSNDDSIGVLKKPNLNQSLNSSKIYAPVFKDTYNSWNLFHPLTYVLMSIWTGFIFPLILFFWFRVTSIWFWIKIIIIGAIAFAIYSHFRPEDQKVIEIREAIANKVPATPSYGGIHRLKMEIANKDTFSNRQLTAVRDVLFKDTGEKISIYPDYLIYSFNVNESNCKKFIDFSNTALKGISDLQINNIETKPSVWTSETLKRNHVKSEAYIYCSSPENNISFKMNYQNMQKYFDSNEYAADMVKMLGTMNEELQYLHSTSDSYNIANQNLRIILPELSKISKTEDYRNLYRDNKGKILDLRIPEIADK